MKTLREWAGGDRATLTLVFTDIVGSAAQARELGNEAMNRLRNDHFHQGERFLAEFEGRLIKTIGDSMMVAFRSIDKALDFARRFHDNPGHPRVRIRAGIHCGLMGVQGEDLFATHVNLAARVAGENKGEEIWLSQHAKDDLDGLGLEPLRHLHWVAHCVTPKGFEEGLTFWSLHDGPVSPPAPSEPTVQKRKEKIVL
jgi:class 3 adenylate cyclase